MLDFLATVGLGLWLLIGALLLAGWILDDCDPWWGFVVVALWPLRAVYDLFHYAFLDDN